MSPNPFNKEIHRQKGYDKQVESGIEINDQPLLYRNIEHVGSVKWSTLLLFSVFLWHHEVV